MVHELYNSLARDAGNRSGQGVLLYTEDETVLEAGFYNMDCMDALKEYPDGYFDLAIVDPPYGDGNAGGGV